MNKKTRQRVNVTLDLLNRFEPDGPKRVTDAITGDDTWYHYMASLEMTPWYHYMASPANAGKKHS